MTKKEALNIIIREAKMYKKHLVDQSILIIYKDRLDNLIKYLEIEFYPDQFQHLTGIENSQTIDLKMMALPYITQIMNITKMTGTYNQRLKDKLCADYIVGGTVSCIGISKYDDKDTYFPRSCLKEDIRNITTYTSQVLAIFKKPISGEHKQYNKIVYHAKGVNLLKLSYSSELSEKINLQSYIPNIKNKKESIIKTKNDAQPQTKHKESIEKKKKEDVYDFSEAVEKLMDIIKEEEDYELDL